MNRYARWGLYAVGAGAAACVSIVALLVSLVAYCGRPPELPCDIDLNATFEQYQDRAFALREAVDFTWVSVSVYDQYTPSEHVRADSGHPYYPTRCWEDHVPEHDYLFVFTLPDGATCEASYYRPTSRIEWVPAFDASSPVLRVVAGLYSRS